MELKNEGRSSGVQQRAAGGQEQRGAAELKGERATQAHPAHCERTSRARERGNEGDAPGGCGGWEGNGVKGVRV